MPGHKVSSQNRNIHKLEKKNPFAISVFFMKTNKNIGFMCQKILSKNIVLLIEEKDKKYCSY